MYPQICRIGPFTVYSYGFMLVLAFVLAVFLARIQAKKQHFDPEMVFNFFFWAFIFGIIGARIFYVIENLRYYLEYPQEIIMLTRGGLSWFGGLILGSVAGIVYLKLKKANFYKTADLVIPFIALAQAIGRIGCFLNGCCFGKESSQGIYFPVHDAVLIPIQLYSSFFLLLIFMVLRFMQDHRHKAGQIFYMYLFLYSVKRFLVEFWRADNKVISYGLTLFQLISLGIFIFSVIMICVIFRKKK